MNNSDFLQTLKESFIVYLKTGARSNKKLAILHGAISQDLHERLNDEKYSIYSLGYGKGNEHKINGRYSDKNVDIAIFEKNVPVAGIAVKYVMSNYSQNSNNYFENMLGETANIRSAQIPYFQIFTIPDKIPYFDKDGNIANWETITPHNLEKYIKLSHDNAGTFLHTPNKTLMFIIHIQNKFQNKDPIQNKYHTSAIRNKSDYKEYYLNKDFDIVTSKIGFDFGNSVIYNDYDAFIQQVVYSIKNI